jgi:hypothetical protein
MPVALPGCKLRARGQPDEEDAVDETYRMLGRDHQADLDREARTRHLAASTRAARSTSLKTPAKLPWRKWVRFVPSRLAALTR